MIFVVRFDVPDSAPCYAGFAKDGALGFAPTTETAIHCETEEIAERWLRNGYGHLAEYGTVEELKS